VLVVDVTTPRPDRDSGSMRALRLMELLVELGYRVDFLPEDGRDAGRYSDALAAAGVAVHHLPRAGARLRWLRAHAADCTAVVVSRYHLAEALFPLLRGIAPQARLVLDTVDLHHLREQREGEQRGDRALLRLSATTRRRELAMVAMADTTWVVSPVEQALLARELPAATVRVVSNVHDAETDVPGPQARRGVLFVGGAGHPPNLDAVSWLLETLWPMLRAAIADLELHLVGDGLPAFVGAPPAGVVVHGHVPDLGPLLRRVRVGVAPLRFGAGVKGKVNLGMAHGLPMVVTGCAAEGMHLVDGEHAFVADAPADFVERVVRLCNDDALWARMSRAGQAHVAHRFSIAAARDAVRASLPPTNPSAP